MSLRIKRSSARPAVAGYGGHFTAVFSAAHAAASGALLTAQAQPHFDAASWIEAEHNTGSPIAATLTAEGHGPLNTNASGGFRSQAFRNIQLAEAGLFGLPGFGGFSDFNGGTFSGSGSYGSQGGAGGSSGTGPTLTQPT